LLIKLPTLVPHEEKLAVALGSFDVVAVDAIVEVEATDAKLSGRSFLSPPVVARTDEGKEEGGTDVLLGEVASGWDGEVALEP
jgi:hypothetical protein